MSKIRQFKTGANRDTSEEKLEYARFMSPLVIKRYAEYMHKNRFLANGDIRDPDNWQKLFGENHQQVCMDSLMRHVMDMWLINDGYEGREDTEEALCGIIFNAMAILYKIEHDKQMLPKKGRKKTTKD